MIKSRCSLYLSYLLYLLSLVDIEGITRYCTYHPPDLLGVSFLLVDMVVLYFDDTTVIFASNIWYQSIISILRSTEVILVVDSKIRTNIIHQNLAVFRKNLLGRVPVSLATNNCKRNNTGEMETLVLLVMGVFVIHPVLALYGEFY